MCPFPLRSFSIVLAGLLGVSTLSAQSDGLAAMSGPAAVTTPAGSVADSAESRRFDIASKPLAEALADFSRQAGVSVSLEGSELPTGQAPALNGSYTPAEALRLLLEGSGLTARFVSASAVIVGKSSTGTLGTGAHPLLRIVVRGVQNRATGYATRTTSTATRTDTPLLDTPQSVVVVTSELISDQSMQSLADVVRYVPGITMGQGEGHRDQPTIRGNSTTADFFVDGVRDDAQYYRDLYNVDRVEALKGPNAMIFGRGGGGGVINRVLKGAQWTPTRSLTVEGGSFDHRRATADLGGSLANAAGRLNLVAERSGGFRDHGDLERRGANPTLALAIGAQGTARLAYEYFVDERRVDRGIPSFGGGPSPADVSTFFGNPGVNRARAIVRAISATMDQTTARGFGLRNRSVVADYDKFYRNTLPGAVNEAGTEVTLSGYRHSMRRRNAFNQTDVTYQIATGRLHHTLLVGTEFGRQRTDQVRNTGYFNDAATSLTVPFDSPTISTPVTFRPSATDPDSRSVATVAAAYVQDQIALTRNLQAVLGVRGERFKLRYHNNRTNQDLERRDDQLSPRAAILLKPVESLSLYASQSLSYLPSAGDQFFVLSPTTQSFEPERFTNREVGLKWEAVQGLGVSAAYYRLDHRNAAAPDPGDPSRVVQTGSQRTTGFELGVNGNLARWWEIAGGFAAQRARITSTTTAASAGASVPLVPRRTLTLWNRYGSRQGFGAGVGIVHQSEVFAAVDNQVRLPAFTRVDAALYVPVLRQLRAQLNLENLLDERYFPTSHGNNNIMPGAPRTARLTIVSQF
jgi:catecholate siderophore receptor